MGVRYLITFHRPGSAADQFGVFPSEGDARAAAFGKAKNGDSFNVQSIEPGKIGRLKWVGHGYRDEEDGIEYYSNKRR